MKRWMHSRRIAVAMGVVGFVALAAASEAAPESFAAQQSVAQAAAPKPPAQPRTVRGNAARGKALALERCGSCHRLAPGMAQEMEGTPLGPDFTSVKRVTSASLKTRVTGKHPTMPKFPNLTNQQIADLVTYINSIRK